MRLRLQARRLLWPDGDPAPEVGSTTSLRIVVHWTDLSEMRSSSGGTPAPTLTGDVLEAEPVD